MKCATTYGGGVFVCLEEVMDDAVFSHQLKEIQRIWFSVIFPNSMSTHAVIDIGYRRCNRCSYERTKPQRFNLTRDNC